MTELELHKFINNNDIELSWHFDELIVCIPAIHLLEFTDIVGDEYFCDGGKHAMLCGKGYVAFDIVHVCDYFNIDPENILKKEEE
jgi:hypothetical protein